MLSGHFISFHATTLCFWLASMWSSFLTMGTVNHCFHGQVWTSNFKKIFVTAGQRLHSLLAPGGFPQNVSHLEKHLEANLISLWRKSEKHLIVDAWRTTFLQNYINIIHFIQVRTLQCKKRRTKNLWQLTRHIKAACTLATWLQPS